MMAFGNGVAFVGQIIKKALSSFRKTGHKEQESPPDIRLMPVKAKKPGDSDKNGLFFKGKAIGRHRKGQKEKPIIITTWAVWESFNPCSAEKNAG